jgi:hypothetical protein
VAQIKIQGKHYNLGRFDTEEAAAKAYNDKLSSTLPEELKG